MRHPRAVNQLVVTYLTCGFAVANATNYYMSSGSGNDSNDGLSAATACKSLGKINNTSFAISDRVYRTSTNTEVAHNLVFAQRAVGIYADWAQNVRIHANIVLGTSDSAYWRLPNSFVSAGSALANEPGETADETESPKNIAI